MRDRDRLGSLVFSDDGSIGAAGAAPGEGVELGIAELRGLADEAGLPWHSRYETEGGARGFLEILRALQDGPTKVRRAAGTAAAAATATAATVTEAGESAPVERSDAAPSDPETSAPVGGEATVSSDPAASDHALWSPGDIGSVYTPTTLYSSGQGGEDASDDLSDDDGDREEGR